MAFGPFENYAPPGVYTRTRVDDDTTGPPTGNRIPVFVGTGREALEREDFELVRGSSSSVDQRVVNEDVNARFVLDFTNPGNPELGMKTGDEARFQVRNFPIVLGDGRGLVTNDVSRITVTVDGELVSPLALDGARGVVTLQVAPQPEQDVRVTYFFNRTDTEFTDDVSAQVTNAPATLLSASAGPYDISAGFNELNLLVDGAEYSVSLTEGSGVAASTLAADINAVVDDVPGFASVVQDNQGLDRLQLQSDLEIRVLSGSANTSVGFGAGSRTDRNRLFHVFNAPIVDGTNGGITTTDPSDVTVHVDGQQVIPSEVDGQSGSVTLPLPPEQGAVVEIRYFHNTWQDTFDHLPDTGIRNVERVGISPERRDFVEGNDYVIDENGRILWGSAVTVETGLHTGGTTLFGEEQISASLIDNRMYLESVDRWVDRSTVPARVSNDTVVLGNTPTLGNARSTELGQDLFQRLANDRIPVSTYRPGLVKVYHGSTASEALDRGPVEVLRVDPDTRRVTLSEPMPPDHLVWATYYYNRLQDDTYTLEVLTESTANAEGTYAVRSDLLNTELYDVRFVSKDVSGPGFVVGWKSGVESNTDAFHVGSAGVNETVTVTFEELEAQAAIFVNGETGPYDFYAGQSDTLHLDVNGVAEAIDLAVAAHGTLVSEGHGDAATFNITATENVFDFEMDGETYSVTLNAGATETGEDIAEQINRAAPATILGTGEEPFDLLADEFHFALNGVVVEVSGLADAMSASDVATAINAAIDGTALTSGDPRTAGNDGWAVVDGDSIRLEASEMLAILAGVGDANTELGFVLGQEQGELAFYRDGGAESDRFILRSRVVPTGPADESVIRVLSGSANETLGFADGAVSHGAESAVNKGATLLGDTATDPITDAFTFDLMVNGQAFIVSIAAGTLAAAASAIDTTLGAEGSAVVEDGAIRITSADDGPDSSIVIGAGDANDELGFEEGQSASQRRVSAQEVASVINMELLGWEPLTTAGDLDARDAFVEIFNVAGDGDYVRFVTFATGSSESFLFQDGSASALNMTGFGVAPLDGANGSDAKTAFEVESINPDGSAGFGLVGQTYTDANTGLRFSVLEAADGVYTTGDNFTLEVSDTFRTGTGRVIKALAGLEMLVDNTTDAGVGDTALVTTYRSDGQEPAVGDFYYITYSYAKTDFSTRLFTRFRDIQANYGRLSVQNPLTLASYLAILNGAVIVGCKQVEKQPGLATASSQAYIDALEELSKPLEAGIIPDILVPLTTDPSVMGAYVNHADLQSSRRYRQERRCIFGVASGTLPKTARDIAQGLANKRAILVYPDSAVLTLDDPATGEERNFVVDGTYMAAALAGVQVSPQFDVATPLTRRTVVGFRRLNRSLDDVDKNRLASAGITVLEDRGTNIRVRDGLTTDLTSRFTSTPSIVAIADHVERQTRSTLDRFIGLKFLADRAQDVELAVTGLLRRLMEQQIIVDFQGVRAEPDPDDPTALRVTAFYAPVFPLKYILVNYTVRSATAL